MQHNRQGREVLRPYLPRYRHDTKELARLSLNAKLPDPTACRLRFDGFCGSFRYRVQNSGGEL